MAKVSFGMIWSVYGTQEVELPEDIDTSNESEIKKYVESTWDDIPLPEGEYISGSDVLDEDNGFEVEEDDEAEKEKEE